jgi:hypothetical protein
MNTERSTRESDRRMDKESELDDATKEFITDMKEEELHDYADTIVSHVDKAVPKALLALGPPLMVGAFYLIMKTTVLMHPALVLCSVLGVGSAFFFAIKYDLAVKACRYSGIGIAMARNKNIELKKQNRELQQRVGELEAQINGPLIEDKDIPF